METEAQADAYSEMFGRKNRPINVGDWLEEIPCLPKANLLEIEREFGRPCPRIELEEGDASVAEVVYTALPKHTREFAPDLFRLLNHGTPPEERLRELRLVLAIMGSEPVVKMLNPEPKSTPASRSRKR